MTSSPPTWTPYAAASRQPRRPLAGTRLSFFAQNLFDARPPRLRPDPGDTTAIWITEVWTDAASHKASLALPEVRAAITKAKPYIAGFEFQIETEPVGGFGLPAVK